MSEYTLESDKLIKIQNTYPDKIPIYFTSSEQSKSSTNDRLRRKFLIPKEYTIASLICVIRKWFKIDPHRGIFLFINNHIPSSIASMSELYEKYKSSDGLLRITYAYENAFG